MAGDNHDTGTKEERQAQEGIGHEQAQEAIRTLFRMLEFYMSSLGRVCSKKEHGSEDTAEDRPRQAAFTDSFTRLRSQCTNVLFWANLG